MKEELLRHVDALAAKLGVSADKIWMVLVAQARIELISAITWALIGLTVALLAARWLRRAKCGDDDASFAQTLAALLAAWWGGGR